VDQQQEEANMAKVKAFNVGPVTLRSMPFWCVGNPLADPFGPKVLPAIDSVQVADLLAEAAEAGLIEATSFHDDDLVPWNPDKPTDDLDPRGAVSQTLTAIKRRLDRAGLSVNTATCSLHGNVLFRRGGLTNPDPAIRKLARLKVERTLRIGSRLGARYFTYWVARDGFEVYAATDWSQVYGRLAEALDHTVDYIRAKRLKNYAGGTIEPKPNEPRGHMFLPTAGHAVGLICGKLKHPAFWGVNPELLQHESMALMNAVLTVAYLVSIGKLTFLHFGNQIKAQFDNDFPPLVGPEGLKEAAAMFKVLDCLGWKGVVEFDCHMLRTEGDPQDGFACRRQFIRNCVTALSIALELAARFKPVAAKTPESLADLDSIMQMCRVDAQAIARRTAKK
jgi:xylose isomerase